MNIVTALLQRRKQRRTLDALRRLDNHLLRDIGLERDIDGTIHGFGRLQDLGR